MKRLTLACGLATLLLAGCQTPAPLAGTNWRITAVNGRATPDNGAYRLRFERGQMSGAAGCNHFGGRYRVSGATLTTGAVAMTEMACSEPASTFESRVLAIIQQPMVIGGGGGGGRMTLTSGAGSIDLIRNP